MYHAFRNMELKCVPCDGAFVTNNPLAYDHHMHTVHADIVLDVDSTTPHNQTDVRKHYKDFEAATLTDTDDTDSFEPFVDEDSNESVVGDRETGN